MSTLFGPQITRRDLIFFSMRIALFVVLLGLATQNLIAQEPLINELGSSNLEAVARTNEGLIEGRLLAWDEDSLSIAVGHDTLILPLETIQAIDFPNASTVAEQTTMEDGDARITLYDGSLIIAQEITFSQNE